MLKTILIVQMLTFFMLLIGGTFARTTSDKKQSKEWVDFITKYETNYKNEMFIIAKPYSYEIDLCEKQARFDSCEMKWCVFNSHRRLTKKWIAIAEESSKRKCDNSEVAEMFIDSLNTAKKQRDKCLRYIQAGNKKVASYKECEGVFD